MCSGNEAHGGTCQKNSTKIPQNQQMSSYKLYPNTKNRLHTICFHRNQYNNTVKLHAKYNLQKGADHVPHRETHGAPVKNNATKKQIHLQSICRIIFHICSTLLVILLPICYF